MFGNFRDLERMLYDVFCWNNAVEKQMLNFCNSKFKHSPKCEARQVHTELNLQWVIWALLPPAH